MDFAPLHIISGYSFLSSGLTIERIKKGILSNSYFGSGLCDKNVLHGIPFFINMMEEIKKPFIIGMEVILDSFEYCLYALNEEGYRALSLISLCISKDEDFKDIIKTNKDHLLGIMVTRDFHFIELLEENSIAFRTTLASISSLTNTFYLGLDIQNELDQINADKIRNFAKEFCYETIAFPSILYLKSDDAIVLEMVSAIKNDEKISIKEKKGECYFKPLADYQKLYKDFELSLTKQVVLSSTFSIHKKRGKMLKFCEDDPHTLLKTKAMEKLISLNLNTEPYLKRLDYEIDVINKMGYSNYFLLVSDYVNFAKSRSILVGPGRGSAAGSLVSFLLGITDIDPLKYNLLFERFLNIERQTMPDIDIDFMDIRRDEVINYLREKYGKERVSNIVTFSTILAKQSLRDVGRIYDLDEKDINLLCKRLQTSSSLRKAYKTLPAFKELVDSDKYYLSIVSLASKIESLPRQAGLHAAGIILNDTDISLSLPVTADFENYLTSQYEMHFLEEQGFLKMDLLGLRNLTTIDICLKLIKSTLNVDVNFDSIDFEDKKIFDLICSTNTMGIFQLESSGMKRAIKTLKPTSFLDVVALLALFRPGPMENIPTYAKRKQGLEKVVYPCKEVEDILKETYGIIVYQEQIMQIATSMAGFSLSEADIFRKAVSKKESETLFKAKTSFIQGCLNKGHSEKISEKVFNDILKFANYGFNKSHSVGYSIIACKMAYLKATYPLQFYASILKTSTSGDDDKFLQYISEMEKFHVKLLPPNINESTTDFEIKGSSVLFPLSFIKGINSSSVFSILKEREENGLFVDIYDFYVRCYKNRISEITINKLIDAGALDVFSYSRASMKLASSANYLYGEVVYSDEQAVKLIQDQIKKPRIPILEDDIYERMEKELELLGVSLSDNPIKYHREELSNLGIVPLIDVNSRHNYSLVGMIKTIKVIKTKKDNLPMAFIKIFDETAELEVVLFPKLYQTVVDIIKKNNIVIIKGRNEIKDEENSFIASSLELFVEG